MTTAVIKTIAIVGATGNQGSSVVKTFLGLRGWQVRALTRDPSSRQAKQLEELGATIVQADLANVEALTTAFAGAHAVFVNTDFWIPFYRAREEGYSMEDSCRIGYDTEVAHAKNAISAALANISTLERFVYSALGPMSAASGGKYHHSRHWETKAAVVAYIENEQPAIAAKTSFIYLGAYATNRFLVPQRDPATGQYKIVLPGPRTTRMPVVDPSVSTGPFVRALVEVEVPGTKLLACDEEIGVNDMIGAWSAVTGKEADFVQMELDTMHQVTGLPYEVLDGAGFLGEYDFMAGVEGRVIRPQQLKEKVETRSYINFLRAQSQEHLLGSQFDQF